MSNVVIATSEKKVPASRAALLTKRFPVFILLPFLSRFEDYSFKPFSLFKAGAKDTLSKKTANEQTQAISVLLIRNKTEITEIKTRITTLLLRLKTFFSLSDIGLLGQSTGA
jgi:hypothetical protein